jgi:hypothetical protein
VPSSESVSSSAVKETSMFIFGVVRVARRACSVRSRLAMEPFMSEVPRPKIQPRSTGAAERAAVAPPAGDRHDIVVGVEMDGLLRAAGGELAEDVETRERVLRGRQVLRRSAGGIA